MRLRLANVYCYANSLLTIYTVLQSQTTGEDFQWLLLIFIEIYTRMLVLLILFDLLSDLDVNQSLLLKNAVYFFWFFHHRVETTWNGCCFGHKVAVLLRNVSQWTSPRVQIVAEWVFCKGNPPLFLMIELLSFWVEATYGICVLIDKAYLVS